MTTTMMPTSRLHPYFMVREMLTYNSTLERILTLSPAATTMLIRMRTKSKLMMKNMSTKNMSATMLTRRREGRWRKQWRTRRWRRGGVESARRVSRIWMMWNCLIILTNACRETGPVGIRAAAVYEYCSAKTMPVSLLQSILFGLSVSQSTCRIRLCWDGLATHQCW